MLMTGSGLVDAERAFSRSLRSRRRASLTGWLRRRTSDAAPLPVQEERSLWQGGAQPLQAVREIPLGAIRSTLEPSRASMFDCCFRPAASARQRWQRLWLAEQRGAPLPPISVFAVGEAYAVRDGHHRVSVARARGAVTIDAVVDRAMPAAAR